MKWLILAAACLAACYLLTLHPSGSTALWQTATASKVGTSLGTTFPPVGKASIGAGFRKPTPEVQSQPTSSTADLEASRLEGTSKGLSWYGSLLAIMAASAALSLRASRRADKHRRLAMAAIAGAHAGPVSMTSRPATRLQAAAAPDAMTTGTPVNNKTMLIVGATGTLGRQIVRQALDLGYDVRCLVRPRQNPADFLRDWGAKTVNGNLAVPKTLPAALVGVHTVIDVATARPEESIKEVDWEGKKALIQCAKAMGIQRYIFFSIVDCDKAPDVPLMNIKRCTELYLQQVGLNYTILRTCGFMQALIQQYAVPMLEGEEVYGTQDNTRIAYLSTQDAARMTLACLKNDRTIGQTLTLAGPRPYSVSEVIKLCEKLGGMEAKVNNVPTNLLGFLRKLTSLFQWTKEISDRLAFSELLSNNKQFSAPMEETYSILGLDPNETQSLESYLQEYYKKMLVRLKEVKAKSGQKGIYL